MRSFTLLLLMLGSQVSQATHLLGGYIQTKSVDGSALSYQITAALYMDEIRGKEAVDQANAIQLCFGDGTTGIAYRSSRLYVNDKSMSINNYTIFHTYAGPNTYQLIASLLNRTGVKNIANADGQLFALRTTFSTIVNQTPTPGFVLSGSPIGANQKATFSLHATDAEGDSLVYSLTKALTSANQSLCDARPVSSYQFPNDLTRRGTFKLNNRSGELTWDAPTELGYYSIAITINEYRRGNFISQTVQEITVLIEDRPGTPATLPAYEPAVEGTFTGLVTATMTYDDATVRLTTFPNPVDDRLQVLIQTSNPTTATLQLTDANGRKLHELTFNRLARQHEQFIGLGSLTPGIYLIRAIVGERTLTRKIVKR